MQVKRYNGIEEDPEGVYVLYADLAACERERDTERLAAVVSGRAAEKAEAEVKALREELADYRTFYKEDWLSTNPSNARLAEIHDRIEARRKEE